MATFEVADSIVAKQAAARISAQKQKQQQKANALNNMLSGLRSKNLSIPTIAVLSVLSHVDKAPSSFDELVLQAQKLTPRQQFCRQYFRSEGCGSKSCQYSHDPEQCLDALGKLNDLSVALKADTNKVSVGKKKEAAEKKEFCNDLFKRGACKLGAKCPRSHDEKAYVTSHNVKKCPVCGECFCHKNSSECSNCYAARRAEAEAQLHPCGNQSKGCANMCIAELCRDCRAAPKFCYAFFDENECTRQDCAFSHDEALYMKVNALKMCPECKTSYCKESSAECRQCRHVKSLHPCATKDCENRCKAEYCQECNAAYRKEQQKKKDKKERKGPLQCVNFPKYCSNKSVLAYRGECEHCKESQSVYVVRG